MLFLIVGGFLIPLLIIITSYSMILWKLHSRTHDFQHQRSNSSIMSDLIIQQHACRYKVHFDAHRDQESVQMRPIIRDDGRRNTWRVCRRTETRAARRIVVACGIFCLAWGPYATMTLFIQFGFDHFISPYSTASLALFAKTAACMNPLIYALSSKSFREKIYLYLN